MKITKRVNVLPIIVLIVFIFVGCAIKDEGMSEFKTYSNTHYTFHYPSNWPEPELVINKEMGHNLVYFPKGDNPISLKVMASRIYPFNSSDENYIEERLNEFEEDIDIEEFIIDGTDGYKVTGEENGDTNTQYLVQKKDIIYQMHFEYQTNDYNRFQSLMDQITKTFEINDIGSLSELENWNKYSIENLEVYYPDNSKIYDSIEEWAKTRVEAFNYITEYLDVQWKYEPIKIFVFNSKEHGEQYGLSLGFAISEYSEIFTEDTQSPGHELAHCISYWINNGERIDSDLIEEGLATYLNMLGNDYHRLTADILQGKNYSIKLLGDDFRKNKEAYTFGASFVKYLIDEYSLELFKEFYSQNKYNEEESFIKFYKKEGNMLVNEWIEYLKTY